MKDLAFTSQSTNRCPPERIRKCSSVKDDFVEKQGVGRGRELGSITIGTSKVRVERLWRPTRMRARCGSLVGVRVRKSRVLIFVRFAVCLAK